MKIPKLLVVFTSLLIFSMLLSGCIESMDVDPADEGDDGEGTENDDGGEGQNQQEPSPTPEPTETEQEEEEKEEEEKGDDPADPTAELNANQTSGEVPLNVNFTLNGTTDESLSLEWTLDFGDGSDPVSGGQLPADETHEYDEVGNYTAFLNVTDGLKTATDNVTITVEEEDGNSEEEEVSVDATIDIVDDPAPLYQDGTTMLPVTVVAGTTVQWDWVSGQHSVTSDTTSGGSFDSGIQDEGSEFTATLETGVYQYACEVHPEQVGVLVVTGDLPAP